MSIATEILRAVHSILTNPPSFPSDDNRQAAVNRLDEIEYGVYVGSRPQRSGPTAVTIERNGGQNAEALNRPYPVTQTAIDLSVWAEGNLSREQAALNQELGELFAILLTQLRGTFAEVEVIDCAPEGEAFQRDQRPRDQSDNWTSATVHTYLITHGVTRGETI